LSLTLINNMISRIGSTAKSINKRPNMPSPDNLSFC
jgi:hypothetical protein